MTSPLRIFGVILLSASAVTVARSAEPEWAKIHPELLQHFQALVSLDTTNPPGNETQAAEYMKRVLEREGIPVKILGQEPNRTNLVARLKGNGSKKPLLVMGHTDTVGVQPEKWINPPFSAARKDGYIYGRGTIDDKDNAVTGMMLMILLKRLNVPLDRDVIFLAEAGEEGSSNLGIGYMIENHWNEIEAEYCLAEGGTVIRRGGKLSHMMVATTEKVGRGVRLVAHGPSGHGSRPMQTNAVLRLTQAVAKVGTWQPPMRLNDTTRTYFERLATVSTPEEAARYNGLLNPQKTADIQKYLAEYEPMHNSMLRTSITPTILKAGFRANVIPSEAEATLDIRALPDEDMVAFRAKMAEIINDPSVEIVTRGRAERPSPTPSRIDTEMFRALEASQKKHYPGAITLPTMSTGASDKSPLQAKGVQTYGIGPMVDDEDGLKGFGAHSDQERILETALYQFLEFQWDAVLAVAASK
jgi:acetylornithine deacetylase/succinyl-diaminopimelate desuccinylase-like protein